MSDGGAPTEEAALTVDRLSVSYGDFLALERASFSINVGACATIISPNGSGKSSIAMAIARLANREGTVRLFGEVAPKNDPVWMVKHGLARVPELEHRTGQRWWPPTPTSSCSA